MEDRMISQPVFEVIAPSGHAYRIWADGRAEGFGDGAIIINRVPMYANGRVMLALNKRQASG